MRKLYEAVSVSVKELEAQDVCTASEQAVADRTWESIDDAWNTEA